MGAHIVDGQFQSDKYPTCPRGKVPLSVRDPTAQDLLWAYAQRRRAVDAEFSADLEFALREAGYGQGKIGTGYPVTDRLYRLIRFAIQRSVDAALGELARQQGGIGQPAASEARSEGLHAADGLFVDVHDE